MEADRAARGLVAVIAHLLSRPVEDVPNGYAIARQLVIVNELGGSSDPADQIVAARAAERAGKLVGPIVKGSGWTGLHVV